MLRFGHYILQSLRKNKLVSFCAKDTYCTVPELAEVRFPEIRRGNYSRLSSEHVNFFKSLLGQDRVLSDSSDVEPYNTDFPRSIKGRSEIVLKPTTTEEVSALLKFCNDNNLAVCPQGGNSGLVGGSTPVFDEIVISTALMNKILHLDEFSGTLTCQSGCILEVLSNYLQERNLVMPLDLGAKGLCHIGGNISTNAGGIRLLRYGNLHGSVLGLEVVLTNGDVLDMLSTMKKDNTGYHLKNLFIGAEGTLGVVTKVAIQCPPLPKAVGVAFLGVNKFEDVLATFKEARSHLGEILSACELIDEYSFERSVHVFKMRKPLGENCKFYMLLETRSGAGGDDLEKINSFVSKMMEKDAVRDAVTTNEPAKIKYGFPQTQRTFHSAIQKKKCAYNGTVSFPLQMLLPVIMRNHLTASYEIFVSQEIWEIRERVSLALFKDGYVYKYDISLPVSNYYKLVEIMRERLEGTSITAVTGFGHLGDGNLHLNICSNTFDEKVKGMIEPFIFEMTEKFKGSISAEHGIGLEKSKYLHMSKSRTSINVMKEIKKLFDPKGILNPYKVLPP